MTPKEYLQQYRDAVRRATAAQDHLDELRSLAERITPNYDSNSGGSQTGDKLSAAVARIVDAEARVDAEITMLIAIERDVEKTIKAVDDSIFRKLLYERYINGKTWEQIAVVMHYSYQHIVHYLHPQALDVVKHLIESNT